MHRYRPQGRITPAHAGKSRSGGITPARVGDHPRPRGEKSRALSNYSRRSGSPPPTRGKGRKSGRGDADGGITPAHAGKSADIAGGMPKGTDHPRPRGEKCRRFCYNAILQGSPPPTRGKETVSQNKLLRRWITPAHAGKRHRGEILDKSR